MALALDLNGLAANHPRVHQSLFGEPFPEEVLQYSPIPCNLLDEMRTVVDACYGKRPTHEREPELVV